MRRLAAVLLLVVFLCGCSGITSFHAFFTPNLASTTGVVSIVHFTLISGPGGTFVNVTFVTLVQNGFGTTDTFCGDVRNQFPMNTLVTANFTPGQPCGTVVQVIP